jgi:hypothetical protein
MHPNAHGEKHSAARKYPRDVREPVIINCMSEGRERFEHEGGLVILRAHEMIEKKP